MAEAIDIGLAPEGVQSLALKRANRKFKARFQYMERELSRQGKTLEESNLDEMETLWKRAKAEVQPQ